VSDFLRNAHFLLQNIRWQDIADVLVVAFLLYQLLKLIRGTQAVQLLVGLAVIFVVGWLAQLLNLRLLEFIFTNGGQAIVIAAVILFQPELRRIRNRPSRAPSTRCCVPRSRSARSARVR